MVNLFEGLRKLSQWSLQRINHTYLPAWPNVGNIGDIDEDDPLQEANRYRPSGFAPNFNGTFYLENTSPVGLPTGNNPFTMIGWVVPISLNPSNEQGLFGYGPSDTSAGYDHNDLFLETNNSVAWRGGGPFNPADPNNALSSSAYNFVGITWDGTTLTLYVNSYYWTATPTSLDVVAGYIRIALGDYWADTADNAFIGTMVDVGIWGICLPSGEINAIIAAGPRQYDNLPGYDFDLETSDGDEILCSNGDTLEAWGNVGISLTSFWNLSEISGVRYDSVGSNNLDVVSL